MANVNEALDRVRFLIRSNLINEENPDGLLISDQNAYLESFEINFLDLEHLLRKD